MGRPNLMNHRKFRRANLNLGIPKAHLRGHLELMWDASYENGDPFIGDATDVELAAGWEGESGTLSKALLECGGEGCPGFIEEVPNRSGKFQVHDLHDHAPAYVKDRWRKEEARRQAGIQERKKREFARQASIGPYEIPERPGSSGNCLDTSLTPAPAPAPAPAQRTKRGAFAPPTVEEVQQLWRERSYTNPITEPEKFHSYYASNGWQVGKNPMRDWKAAAAGWATRAKENSGIRTASKPVHGIAGERASKMSAWMKKGVQSEGSGK